MKLGASRLAVGILLVGCGLLRAEAPEARLLRFPDVYGDTIVFSHAGDLWSVSTSGGLARRLTTGTGLELFPRFSPDGKWIAFTGQYDGTFDVYVMPPGGGEPRRLTYYPSRDNNERMGVDNMVIGWTPDGKIVFRGQRGPIGGFVGEPYTVRPEGGPVERLPLPESGVLSFSPDGTKIAYTRIFRDFRTWKRYKGGLQQDVFIYDLKSKNLDKVTDWEGTDTEPMWLSDSIYFVSDREDWKLNLWRYDVATKQTQRVTHFKEFDVKWPHSGSGKIVFENGGFLYLLDPLTAEPRKVRVSLPDDAPLARRRWIKVDDRITDFAVSPGGQRALVSARGDVFTIPVEHGNTRNLTDTQGVRERGAVWAPDGKSVAYISDASGEEEIYVAAQDGKTKPRAVTTGSHSWHFPLVFSPDSKKICWAERSTILYYADIADGKPVQVDRADVSEIRQYAFSPDSKWIAYAKDLANNFPAIFLYSLESKAITQASGEEAASYNPQFDPEGKYLFFLSDRELAPTLGNLELSYTVNRPTRPHALTLRSDSPSPFAPQSDEVGEGKGEKESKEAAKDSKGEKKGEGEKKDAKEPFRIDLPGLSSRVVAFPVPPGNYSHLAARKGRVYFLDEPTEALGEDNSKPRRTLHVFDLEKRKNTAELAPIDDYDVAPDAAKVLYRSEKTLGIVEAKEGMKVGDGKLDLSGLKMELDPKAEWAQIYSDVWRRARDFFYLSDMGKIDWPAMRKRYEVLLPHVAHRYDLTYVLGELVSELGSGHAYVGGGDQPHPDKVTVGVLGADLEADPQSGRYRIRRILAGQNWIEGRRSPLTEPGIQVSNGDYILSIDGKEVKTSEEPYRLFEETVGRTVTLRVNSKPSLEGAREVTVRPLANEWDLRYYNWVEDNRLKVEKATSGRIGYVHIPDMGARGLKEFLRQYYPQIRKEGLIVDVRYNGGGFVSQMILERLRRILAGMDAPRDERPQTYPAAAFNGPMVALLNHYSASDGDIFPYFFRHYGLGPLIGTRSWGGVVGIRGLGSGLVDGGYAFIPEFATYSLKSQWVIENHGVDPDIEVDNAPADEMAGKDAQLERGIQEVVKLVEAKKPVFPPRPESKDLTKP